MSVQTMLPEFVAKFVSLGAEITNMKVMGEFVQFGVKVMGCEEQVTLHQNDNATAVTKALDKIITSNMKMLEL